MSDESRANYAAAATNCTNYTAVRSLLNTHTVYKYYISRGGKADGPTGPVGNLLLARRKTLQLSTTHSRLQQLSN